MNFPLAPQQGSSIAYEHDVVFYALVVLTIIFTVIVYGMVVFFAVRYRRGSKVNRHQEHHENLLLEIAWTAIPTLLGLVMFFFGAKLFIEMRTSPKNGEDIYVVGKQWMWHMQHSNGVRENNTLHIPVGKPVRLTLISQDVIHAFYVPDFRSQIHVVPGRYTTMWFEAVKPGRYPLYCAMYCGTQHSEMAGYVYAMPAKEYAEWLNNGGNNVAPMSMEERGGRLFKVLSCDSTSCHQSASTNSAPSLVGIYGKQRVLSSGENVTADEAYLRESILKPNNRITAGYLNTMPTYDQQLSEEDVLDLIAYIHSLNMPATKGKVMPGEGVYKGSVSGTQANTLDEKSGMAIGQEESRNLGETKLSETGAAVNAVAAENRMDRK
jgi:cytochrome c oxidase subunit 2